jgi:tyrosine-protein phosphatase YwqE
MSTAYRTPAESERENSIDDLLSEQALDMLDQIAAFGIFGKTRQEVAARMIDKALAKWAGARPEIAIPDIDE